MTLKTGFIMAIVAQVSDEARGPPVFVFSKNVHAMSGLRTGIFAPSLTLRQIQFVQLYVHCNCVYNGLQCCSNFR